MDGGILDGSYSGPLLWMDGTDLELSPSLGYSPLLWMGMTGESPWGVTGIWFSLRGVMVINVPGVCWNSSSEENKVQTVFQSSLLCLEEEQGADTVSNFASAHPNQYITHSFEQIRLIMSDQISNSGRNADGNGNDNRAVIYWRPEIVPLVIAIASSLFNNQLPGDVIAVLLRLAVDGHISQINAAVAVAVSSNGQILQLNAAYANYTALIYNSLTIYAAIQVPIFAAVFSAPGPIGCQIRWSPIIVSGIASAAIIVALFLIFVLQFNLLRRRGQVRRQLRKEVLFVFSVPTANKEEHDDDLDIYWFAQRAAFLVILMAFTVCCLLSFTPVRCPHTP